MTEMTTGAPSAAASSAAPATASAASSAAPVSPASATATPADAGTSAPAPSPQERGPIPYERHETILHGAYHERDQARQALQALKEQYGWVEAFQKDPREHLSQWMDQVAKHPEWGSWLDTKAAQVLRSRRGSTKAAPAASEEPQPNVPITDAAGNVVDYTYSAKQLKAWHEWNQAQQDQALAERLAPLEQLKAETEHHKVQAELQQQADHTARDTLAKWRSNPLVAEHFDAIKQEFIANEAYGDNFAAAALTVLTRDVLPTRDAATSAKVLDHLKTQAQGASVHPSGAATPSRPSFKTKDGREDWDAALRWFAEHPDDAASLVAQR